MKDTYPLRREKIGEEVFFSSLRDSRFKTDLLTLNFVLPLKRETVTENALIPLVLEKGSASFPAYRTFSMELNRLYGASVGAGCSKIGDNEILTLSISTLDDAYALKGEKLLKTCGELLCGLLFDPVLEDGLLAHENLELQKQYLWDSIEAEKNDKRSYALGQTLRLLFENDPCGLRKLGYTEDLEKLTDRAATDAYLRILSSAQVEIFHVGCGNPGEVKETFASAFSGIGRRPEPLLKTKLAVPDGMFREITEEKPVSQSKLCLGFKTGVGPTHSQLSALRLMNGVLGGTTESKLFLNVREKRGLCYYCSSRSDRTKGILLIDCGVDREKVDEARGAILGELAAIRRGEVTEDELNFARLSLQNGFRSVGETASSLESFYLTQTLLGVEETPFDQCEKLAQVTKEEVAAAAELLELSVSYLLTEDGGEEGADA